MQLLCQVWKKLSLCTKLILFEQNNYPYVVHAVWCYFSPFGYAPSRFCWRQFHNSLQKIITIGWSGSALFAQTSLSKNLGSLCTIQCFPTVGGQEGGDTLGIRLPKHSLLSGIWKRNLAQGQELTCFSEKTWKKLCLNLKTGPGDFWHKIVSHE